MTSPAKKHAPATEIAPSKVSGAPVDVERDEDAEDLEAFLAVREISLRATAKLLDKLIRPAS